MDNQIPAYDSPSCRPDKGYLNPEANNRALLRAARTLIDSKLKLTGAIQTIEALRLSCSDAGIDFKPAIAFTIHGVTINVPVDAETVAAVLDVLKKRMPKTILDTTISDIFALPTPTIQTVPRVCEAEPEVSSNIFTPHSPTYFTGRVQVVSTNKMYWTADKEYDIFDGIIHDDEGAVRTHITDINFFNNKYPGTVIEEVMPSVARTDGN